MKNPESIYVVRRSFKAHGNLFEAGQVIEDPASIKLFRSRLNSRDIVVFSPDTIDLNRIWLQYLSTRVTKAVDNRLLVLCGYAAPETPKVEEVVEPEQPVTTAQAAKPIVTKVTKVSSVPGVVTK